MIHPHRASRPIATVLTAVLAAAGLAPLSAAPVSPRPVPADQPLWRPSDVQRQLEDLANGIRWTLTIKVSVSDQPLDRAASWIRLGDVQRALVRTAQTPPVAEADAPPYPVAGLAGLERALAGVDLPSGEGPVTVRFEVSSYGTVTSVHSEPALGERWQMEVLHALADSGFRAARCGERRCNGQLTLTLERY